MKQIAILVFVISSFLACSQPAPTGDVFGEEISTEGAISTDELRAQVTGKGSVEATVSGNVEAVCQKKGCWMILATEDGEGMRVTFKDYGFFVPLDLSGDVVIKGKAVETTTSVEDLRHYAEDEGASEEAIAAITEPLREITFEAVGVKKVK